jgi:DUF1365 family protein
MVLEVKNTFGGQHPYVLPVDREGQGEQLRHSAAKAFYVSPFIEMAARYQFRVTPPGERVAIMIAQTGEEGSRLMASLRGRRRPLADRALAWAALLDPLMTLKVTVGIHLEAFVLWVKGAQLQARPDPIPDPIGAPVPRQGGCVTHGDRCQAG